MQIHVIRHTTPEVERGICYGQTDLALKGTFEEEYAPILTQLPNNVSMIYSSPLQRCKRLADKLGDELNIAVASDHRLQELNFGNWEMQRWDDINQEELNHWMNDFVNVVCPEGESYQQLADRVAAFLKELVAANYSRVAIVTHAGVIKAIHSIMNNVSLANAMCLKIAYGEVKIFEGVGKQAPADDEADYYFENGLMVFTARYHLKRGHCCKNGCRHCPYGFKKK